MRRFAVLGVGAVGGYFGGRIAAHGFETHFIARGQTLSALQQRGLTVRSPLGDIWLAPSEVRAVGDAHAVGPVDAVLLAVKAWQVAALLPTIRQLVAGGGVVLPLQNGVEIPTLLAAALGRERVLGGLCRILAEQRAPAEIVHLGAVPEVMLGALDSQLPSTQQAAAALGEVLHAASVQCQVRADIAVALWEKLAFIAAFSGLGATARATIGELRALPATRRLLEQAVSEVRAVAARYGIALAADLPQKTLAYFDALPATATSSLQRDLLAELPSELEAQVGAVARLGQAAGEATPLFTTLYACLLPTELRARQRAAGD